MTLDELHNSECLCHRCSTCNSCKGLDEEEASALASGGREGLADLLRARADAEAAEVAASALDLAQAYQRVIARQR